MQLIAGRTGQEYNQRKKRNGAFWEDRYHATAIEDGDHLFRCFAYIDLNMVRAGVVEHPSQWPYSGYNEIQNPRRKNVLIDYNKFMELVGTNNYEEAKLSHKGWVDDYLDNDNGRDSKWSKSIAVGGKEFVDEMKSRLGALAKGRMVKKAEDNYQLREPSIFYNDLFKAKKADIGSENTYIWDINL